MRCGLENELSAAQDRIGAAERRATQAEQRHSLLQKRMDDWDAFDPDLHAALNASLPPPIAGEQMQSTGTAHPAGSEATVQSTHQVQAAATTGATAHQGYVTATTLRQSVHEGTTQFSGIPQGVHIPICASGTNISTSSAHSTS